MTTRQNWITGEQENALRAAISEWYRLKYYTSADVTWANNSPMFGHLPSRVSISIYNIPCITTRMRIGEHWITTAHTRAIGLVFIDPRFAGQLSFIAEQLKRKELSRER